VERAFLGAVNTLERGVPAVPLMGAPAHLTGPCRPVWRGKLELCDDGAWDVGWEALFGEAAVRCRVARGAKMGAEEMMGGGLEAFEMRAAAAALKPGWVRRTAGG